MIQLETYQRYQHWFEALILSAFWFVNNTILATSVIMENARGGATLPFQAWEPFAWEYTSALSSLLLVPLVVMMLKYHPITWQLKQTVAKYLLFSLVFSVLHVAIMVGLRHLIYWTQDMTYHFGDITYEFFYEYRKDLWSFLFIIVVIHSYQFILGRLSGEASMLSQNEDAPMESVPDRFLVKKLGKEFIVKISDIEWMESSGNYVNLHCSGRVYPIRATLSGLVEKLSGKGFCRIHRSYGVNLDAINTITPMASGDSEILLVGGKVLNLSRRYKEQFKEQLQ